MQQVTIASTTSHHDFQFKQAKKIRHECFSRQKPYITHADWLLHCHAVGGGGLRFYLKVINHYKGLGCNALSGTFTNK